MQPYWGNIRKDINRQVRWLTADRGPAAACELLRAVAEYAERKRREIEAEAEKEQPKEANNGP